MARCEVYIVVQKHVSCIGKLVVVLEIQTLFNFLKIPFIHFWGYRRQFN